MNQHLKSYIGLIVSFVHLINRNHLWPQQIRREKQILPKQIHLCAHLYHLYFIIFCYKGRKDTIVPGGSQFTRYNLSVSLSTGKAKLKNQVGIVLCGSLQFQLVARKPAFYSISDVNRTIRRCLFSDLGQNQSCHFLPYFNYNSAGFFME